MLTACLNSIIFHFPINYIRGRFRGFKEEKFSVRHEFSNGHFRIFGKKKGKMNRHDRIKLIALA